MTWFSAYLLGLLAVVVWDGVQNLRVQAPYNIGDWLINYSGGFVRRGLIGSAVLLLSRLVHQSPGVIVVALQIVLYAALYWTIWLIVRPIRWRPWTVALALSPATLGFLLLTGGGAFRKDLLFLLFLSVLLLLLRQAISDRGVMLYLSVAAALIALSHEGLMVYWPYLLAAVAISRQSFRRSIGLGLLPTIILVALTGLVSRYPGNLDQAMQICSSIGAVYIKPESGFCGGSIVFLGKDSAFYRFQVLNSIRTNHFLGDYGVLLLLSLLPCVLGIWKMWHEPRTRLAIQQLLPWSTAAILCSTILFVFAVDWGRWIYIHVFSLMLILFFISGTADRSSSGADWEWPRGSKGVVTGVVIAVYLLSWHLPSTGYDRRGWGYIGMARRHIQNALHRRPDAQFHINEFVGGKGPAKI